MPLMPTNDERLRESVLKTLAGDGQTADLDLRVGVLNAVVHLGGEAPSEATRLRAGAAAAQVAGVRGVVNRIEAPGAPSPARTVDLSPSDEWSASRDE